MQLLHLSTHGRGPSQTSRRSSPKLSHRRSLRTLCFANGEKELAKGVKEGRWTWKGHTIRYQRCGESGPPVVCIHGFGGNIEHWRKNLPVLGKSCRAFAIDLLGYGYSDKPDPRQSPPNSLYCFETWSTQTLDFVDEFCREPAFLVCNSIGGIAGLQAAVDRPERVRGVQVANISLRMLHTSKQSPLQRPFVGALQRTLRDTPLGPFFFSLVAKERAVTNILKQCYGNPEAVTEELVQAILKPGLEDGAAAVFLDFISYSGGPLPEELLPQCKCPVSIVWGEADPWEPLEKGRAYGDFPSVEEFRVLPGAGHCPQDEVPDAFNALTLEFIGRHHKQLVTQ